MTDEPKNIDEKKHVIEEKPAYRDPPLAEYVKSAGYDTGGKDEPKKFEAEKSAEPKADQPKDEPIVHGEGAQRFANKNATHSERVLHGNVVTPPVRKERYEHPERNQ